VYRTRTQTSVSGHTHTPTYSHTHTARRAGKESHFVVAQGIESVSVSQGVHGSQKLTQYFQIGFFSFPKIFQFSKFVLFLVQVFLFTFLFTFDCAFVLYLFFFSFCFL